MKISKTITSLLFLVSFFSGSVLSNTLTFTCSTGSENGTITMY